MKDGQIEPGEVKSKTSKDIEIKSLNIELSETLKSLELATKTGRRHELEAEKAKARYLGLKEAYLLALEELSR